MGGVHFDTRRNAHLPYENLTFGLDLKTLSRMGKEVVPNCPESFWSFSGFFWSSRGGPGSLPGALGVRRGDFESFPSEKRRLREQPRPGKTAFFGIGLPPTREHRF